MWFLPLFWLVLFVAASCLFLNFWIWAGLMTRRAYSAPHDILCPETGERETVRFDGWEAARSRLAGKLNLRLGSCTRWPVRRDCDQACARQAIKHQEELVALHRLPLTRKQWRLRAAASLR
jgi:hypothetical protein